jgi:hypothetical protein
MNIYIEDNDFHATLTTWIYKGFWQAYAALQQGHKPYFHWQKGKFLQSYSEEKKFAEIPNAYNWYFEQPYFDCQPGAEEVRTWDTDVNTGLFSLYSLPLSEIKSFYKQHLRFNSATNIRGEAIVKKYNIDFSNTIGITWRGTDIYLDGRPRIPIEVYFPFIDDILKDNPQMRIMCTAEERKILDPLLAKYPQAFLIEEFFQAEHGAKVNPERNSPFTGYERGLQPALMVWLFSKCKYYIKNRSSTGAVASWLSDGRIVSIAHPETLGHDNKIDMAEIEGKLYPLIR